MGKAAFPNFSFDCLNCLKVCNTNSHTYIHSNPSNYSQLSRCLAEEPMACGSPICKEGSHGESLPFHGIQQPRYPYLLFNEYLTSPAPSFHYAMLLPSAIAHNPTHSYSPQENTSSLALLFGANTSPTSTHSQPLSSSLSYLPTITTVPDSLPAVILTGDSTDTTLPPLCPPTELRHSHSVDFLDLLNKTVLPLSSPKENNPHSQWMPTPDRPRMFPRKLY